MKLLLVIVEGQLYLAARSRAGRFELTCAECFETWAL